MKFSVSCRKQTVSVYEVDAKTADEAMKSIMAGQVKPLRETVENMTMTPTQVG